MDVVAQPQTASLGERDVPFILKRSRRRRSIAFSIDGNGLVVSAPWNASDSRIRKSMADGAAWIIRKLDEWSGYKPREQRWTDGEQLAYLGNSLTLNIVTDPVLIPPVLHDQRCLRVTVANAANEPRIHEAVVGWYRRHAARNFTDRIGVFAASMQLPVPKMFLSNARTQWGSCNTRKQVRLNWRLVQAPQEVIDYVVVHELAHLFEMNHSKRFWRIVERHCPEHMEVRKHLNERGHWYLDI